MDQRRRHQTATIRKRSIGRCEVERRCRHAVTIGNGHRINWRPIAGILRTACAGLAQFNGRYVENAQRPQEFLLAFAANHFRDMRGANVRRFRNHVRDAVFAAIAMEVVDRKATDADRRLGLDHGVRVDQAKL